MKHLILTAAIALGLSAAQAQNEPNEIQKDLRSFSHIVASARVNLVLKKGEKESIRLVYDNVSKSKINIEVTNHTLHIYLDNARKIEKMDPYYDGHGPRHSMYQGVTITAYVTYNYLEGLEIRGNQELTVLDPIDADEFRLKAYGENEIRLTSLTTDFFKATLYGQNILKITNGKVVEQKYKLFGENKIDTREMKSAYASASIFGEGNMAVNTTEEIRVDAFGEPSISVVGGGNVNKRLVFGHAAIHKY